MFSPSQSAPPAKGGGSVQVLVLERVQSTPQELQELQIVQSPAIGVFGLKFNKRVLWLVRLLGHWGSLQGSVDRVERVVVSIAATG